MRKLSGVVFLVCFIVLGLFRLNVLNNTPIETDNFTTVNKIEIYILGLVASIIAYPIYPEIAYEHLQLYKPGTLQTKHTDVFLKSSVVQKAIKDSRAKQKPIRLYWDTSVYSFHPSRYWETRTALALNGAWLITDATGVIIKTPLKYPQKAYAPLIGFIGIEEGLFWILQQEGWYYPKTLYWRIHENKSTKPTQTVRANQRL